LSYGPVKLVSSRNRLPDPFQLHGETVEGLGHSARGHAGLIPVDKQFVDAYSGSDVAKVLTPGKSDPLVQLDRCVIHDVLQDTPARNRTGSPSLEDRVSSMPGTSSGPTKVSRVVLVRCKPDNHSDLFRYTRNRPYRVALSIASRRLISSLGGTHQM